MPFFPQRFDVHACTVCQCASCVSVMCIDYVYVGAAKELILTHTRFLRSHVLCARLIGTPSRVFASVRFDDFSMGSGFDILQPVMG